MNGVGYLDKDEKENDLYRVEVMVILWDIGRRIEELGKMG